MEYQLTVLDGMVTRFNEKYQDWSGEEGYFDVRDTTQFTTDQLTVDVLKDVINKNYMLDLTIDDIDLEGGCFSQIMDDDNNCDPEGKNLVDYWFKVEKVERVDLENLVALA